MALSGEIGRDCDRCTMRGHDNQELTFFRLRLRARRGRNLQRVLGAREPTRQRGVYLLVWDRLAAAADEGGSWLDCECVRSTRDVLTRFERQAIMLRLLLRWVLNALALMLIA